MQISHEQSRAIAHGTGPALVLAGPGSGKTLVITERTNYLIEHAVARPEEILVITFTKAAAMEMKERFLQLSGGRTRVTFGTFHAVFFQILKYAYHYTADNILREDQKYRILGEIADGLRLDYEDEKDFLSDLAAEISLVKNEQIPLEHYYAVNCSDELFRTLYQRYQDRLMRANLIDFDDMLVYCYQLFRERKDILAAWQKRFRFILVDEFQDINTLQYEVVRMLAAGQNNFFAVGDDDQSIYRFRGAKPEIMRNYKKDYPNAELYVLDENYRSHPDIVKMAGLVIGENTKRFQKHIHCMASMEDIADEKERKAVEMRVFPGQDKEALCVINEIRKKVQRGEAYQNIAILTRTNTGGRYIAEKLMEFQIPFRMKDSIPNLYDHWIAKDLFAYIRLAMGIRDRKDFLQIMNRPKRYISRDCVDTAVVSFERLRTWYDDKPWMIRRIDDLEDNLKRLQMMSPFAAVNYIRRGMEYDQFIEEYAEYRRINAEELTELLDEIQESCREFKTYRDWFEHIDDYKKMMEEQNRKNAEDTDAVMLLTLHGSKGLEFDNVFIIDINEGIIPHKKAVLDADIEEERRLFYVGMTRAKKYLALFCLKEKYGKEMDPSRFLTVLGTE